MHDYKIIKTFSESQKDLLKRRLKFYIEYNGFSLSIVVSDLNLIYLENNLLKKYADDEFLKRPKPKIINSYDGDIPIEDDRIQKFCVGITNRKTGITKYVGLMDAELNIVAALLCKKKYLLYPEFDFKEGSSLIPALTLVQHFDTQIDINKLFPMEGDYIQYDIDPDRIKQNILRISYSESGHFFVVSNISSIFTNKDGLENYRNFKIKNYKNQRKNTEIRTGWIITVSNEKFLFFLKLWASSKRYECLFVTDLQVNDHRTTSIAIQDVPAIYTSEYQSGTSAIITKYQSCDPEEYEQAIVLVKDYTEEDIADFPRSIRSAVPKPIEDGYEKELIKNDIKKTQSTLTLVANNSDNSLGKKNVMNDKLGEQFIEAVLDYKRDAYLECIAKGVDVNYQSKKHGMAAIHAAGRAGNSEAIEILQSLEGIDLLALSDDGDWLASDIAALVKSPSADILMQGEIKQMKARGIRPEEFFAKSARQKESNQTEDANFPADDMPSNG